MPAGPAPPPPLASRPFLLVLVALLCTAALVLAT